MSRVTARQEPNELMLRDILDLCRRQRMLIILVVLVCLCVGIVQAMLSTPIYRATVEIMVEARTPNSPLPDVSDPLYQVTTQAPAALDVVTQIELLQSQLILNQAARPAELPIDRSGRTYPGIAQITAESRTQTGVLYVNIDSAVPQYAANIARVLPGVFNDFMKKRRQEQVDSAINYLKGQQTKEADRVKAAEVALDTFRRDHEVSDIDIERQMKAEKVSRSDIEKVVAQRDLYAAKARLDAAIAARRALPEFQDSTTTRSNTEAIELQRKVVNDLTAQREQLLTRYQPTSQAMQKVDAELKKQTDFLNNMPREVVIKQKTRNPLIDSYDTNVSEARLALQAAEAASVRMGAWSTDNARGMKVYSLILSQQKSLQRDLDEAQSALNLVNRNLADLQVRAQSIKEAAVALSDPDQGGLIMVKPNWAKNLALAILVGLALAFALAVIRDRAADRVVSVAETDQLVGALPLGYIPSLPRKTVQSLLPAEPIEASVDLSLGWSSTTGFPSRIARQRA